MIHKKNKCSDKISQRSQYAKGGVGRWYWDLRDRISMSHVKGTRILDAGCGEGVTLEKLVNQFPKAQVQGIDIDEDNLAICQEHNLPVEKASLYKLPFPDKCFDSCTFMEVVEHLKEPEKALMELARVIKPDGNIVIVYPVDWMMWLVRIICLRFREARNDPGHVRQWNRKDMEILLGQCGFQPIFFRSLPLPPPFMLHGLIIGQRKN